MPPHVISYVRIRVRSRVKLFSHTAKNSRRLKQINCILQVLRNILKCCNDLINGSRSTLRNDLLARDELRRNERIDWNIHSVESELSIFFNDNTFCVFWNEGVRLTAVF